MCRVVRLGDLVCTCLSQSRMCRVVRLVFSLGVYLSELNYTSYFNLKYDV